MAVPWRGDDMETWSWSPSFDSGDHSSEAKVLESSLGDGYVQSVGMGINNIKSSYPLVFTHVTLTELSSMLSFLEARGGHEEFLFQPKWESSATKWKCKKWSFRPQDANLYVLNATFERSYNL
jgi:phage-related protein